MNEIKIVSIVMIVVLVLFVIGSIIRSVHYRDHNII